MSTRRYRLILKDKGKEFSREINLNNDGPVVYFLNWVEGEYGFETTIKEIWWLRDDGVEEQIR